MANLIPTRVRTQRWLRLAGLLGALALMAGVWAPAAGAAAPPVSGPGVVQVAPDYFSREWGDPMDFANTSDFDTTAPGPMIGSGGAGMGSGQMNVQSSFFYLLRSIGPVIPTSATRDSDLHPLVASSYNRVSFRLYSPNAGVSAIGFQTCDDNPGACEGVKYFTLRAGWHTYNLDMTGNADADGRGFDGNKTQPWSGIVKNIFIVPSVNGAIANPNLTFDWIRITPTRATTNLTFGGGGSGDVEVGYDTDGDAANDSTLGATFTSTAGAKAVDLGGLPAGNYRFYTVQGGTRGTASGVVRLDEPPAQVVLDPDEVGGDDWATSVRGNPWDFNEISDVWIAQNTNFSVGSGEGHGSSGGSQPNDPALLMNTSDRNIDASLYHRASVRIRYDGPWGLEHFGGGMVGRFVWVIPGSPYAQVSQDFVVTTSQQTYTVDLKTVPAAAILDNGGAGNVQPLGWGNPGSEQVSYLRFDPHEDANNRSWHIDEVRLARNDRVAPTFNIRFMDNAFEAGTIADVYADPDRNPGNGPGVRIAHTGVQAGINTVTWDGAGAVPNSYWIYTLLTDPAGNQTGTYSTGQLDVSGPPQTAPVGSLDLATGVGPGALRVAGWSFDPDNAAPVDVHIYVDGQGFNLGPATLSRGDIAGYGYGANHGYDATLGGLAAGAHNVCAYGINNGPGGNSQLGCRVVNVPSNSPFGSLDLVESAGNNSVRVAGWTIDPNTSAPIDVNVYVDGQGYNLGAAWLRRPDVANYGLGSDHGYDAILPGVVNGQHTVCAYGINQGPGDNSGLGCRQVVVK